MKRDQNGKLTGKHHRKLRRTDSTKKAKALSRRMLGTYKLLEEVEEVLEMVTARCVRLREHLVEVNKELRREISRSAKEQTP